jgi:predicted secreted protein
MGARRAGKKSLGTWLAILCLTGFGNPLAAAERLSLFVGQAAMLRLDSNPSTGFSWVVDPATQSLDAVGIENFGAEKAATAQGGLVGKPVVQRFRVTGRLPGQAVLVFSYLRSWENKRPTRQQVYEVDVRTR